MGDDVEASMAGERHECREPLLPETLILPTALAVVSHRRSPLQERHARLLLSTGRYGADDVYSIRKELVIVCVRLCSANRRHRNINDCIAKRPGGSLRIME